jgi:hypothetical protein
LDSLHDRVAVERVDRREVRSLWQIARRVPLRDDDLAAFGYEPRSGRASSRAVTENRNSAGHAAPFIQPPAFASRSRGPPSNSQKRELSKAVKGVIQRCV